MVASFDWGLLIIAASGTICAIIAMVKVFRITGRLEGLLSALPKNPLKAFTSAFVADVLTDTLTRGIEHPDGSKVTIPDLLDSYVMKYGPAVWARVETQLPELTRIALSSDNSPRAGQTAGAALAGQRWGGGLKAAQGALGLAKAVKSPALVEKIQQGVEVVQAVRQMVPAIQEIRAELGGGDSNGGPSRSYGESKAGDVWCPQ
jgi:hypothetical protein